MKNAAVSVLFIAAIIAFPLAAGASGYYSPNNYSNYWCPPNASYPCMGQGQSSSYPSYQYPSNNNYSSCYYNNCGMRYPQHSYYYSSYYYPSYYSYYPSYYYPYPYYASTNQNVNVNVNSGIYGWGGWW